MTLIEKIRKYMASEKIDYLLVNSTNEFLVEYNDLSENSRYFLTGFSGSTGDALITQNELFLFVDGRYHQQADLEVNDAVKVVKLKLKQSPLKTMVKKLKSNKTFAMCAKKNSQGKLEMLEGLWAQKNIRARLLDFDPVMEQVVKSKGEISDKGCRENACLNIDVNIAGMSACEKFNVIADKIKSEEAILATNCEEVSYLCNLRDFSSNFSSQIAAKCLILKNKAVLFTDLPVEAFCDKFLILPLKSFEGYIGGLSQVDLIYVDKTTVTAYDYGVLYNKAAALKENYLRQMKSVKNDSEILHMKSCFQAADKSLTAVRDFIEKNNEFSEYDIEQKLEAEFKKNGAKSLSFKSIVAKDSNAALAHYSKNSKEEMITEGSLVLIDCGAYFDGGYATDMTRVFVKGEPSKMQKKVYTHVLKAFLKAFNKKISLKTSGYSLDKVARKILLEQAPSGFAFNHALGHGIGISVHEAPPSIGPSPAAKKPLVPNMCFTIEPGLYKKGSFGVRLENTCYLAKEGEQLFIKSFSNMCFEKKLIDFNLLSRSEKKQLKTFEVK